MPIYEYLCSGCNLKFELLRPLSQVSEDASCPQCHARAKRVLSSFRCSFAGSEDLSEDLFTEGSNSSPCSTCSAASCDACRLR